MIGSLSKALKSIFGDKAQRDLKEVQPLVDRIKEEFAKLAGLSNDELRARTTALKARVADRTKESDDKVDALRKEIDDDPRMDITEREKRYEQIDKILADSLKEIEEVLEEILPEAFAVVKETARRFKENTELRVKATEMDKDLAIKRPDAIRIEGDEAIWKNT